MSITFVGWGRFPVPGSNPPARKTVPAPSTDTGALWLWDLLWAKAPALAEVGFDAIQTPPPSKAQGGSGEGCDGYGVNYRRDLGDFNWQFSTPTRYGTAQSLRRMVARAHAYGLDVKLDIVLHQLAGGEDGVYRYPGADGRTMNGRGAMHPGCFRRTQGGAGTQPEDEVPAPADDFSFGDELCYQHSSPPGYTWNDALEWGDWLFRTTGADGGRLDDLKGLYLPFVRQFMDHGAMGGKSWYAEFFDGDPGTLAWYAQSAPMDSRSRLEDFNGHFAIANACNTFCAYPMNNMPFALEYSGLAAMFVENPDTDQNGAESVISNKLLGYARALTVPCAEVLVYAVDYFGADVWPGCYGLKPWIDNLLWINRVLAYGAETTRWIDDKVLVTERDGNGGDVGQSPGLITALNFDTWNQRTVTVQTGFPGWTQLHDYTGRHPDIWTDAWGNATFTIPANAYAGGQSYLCFSRAGVNKPVTWEPRHTTQTFFGAPDLSIGPATQDGIRAGAVYVRGGTEVMFRTAQNITAHLLQAGTPLHVNKPPHTGWYDVLVCARSMEPINFELDVTYLGA